MNKKIGILHLEDSFKDSELIQSVIQSGGIEHEYFLVDNEKDFIDVLETKNIDIILSDYSLPDYNGNEALKVAREKYPFIPFLFVSGIIGEDAAINSMLNGATDYVLKNKLSRLVPAIKRALLEKELKIKHNQDEKELKESQNMLYDAQRLAHLGAWSWEEDIDHVTWTEELYQIAGLDPKLPAPTYAEHSTIYTPQSWHLLKTAVEKAMKSGEPYQLELELIRPEGSIRNVIAFGGAKVDSKGHMNGLFGTIQDITERKRTELELILANEAVLQSEKNFRRSISESPMGIRIVSADGEIIYANKALLDIYGFNSLEEFTSTPVINRYTPESYAQHQERKEKRKNGHDVFDYEISIICKNAEIRHVKVSRREVQWNGTKHYQVINFDITEQKKLSIDLIAAKEHAEQSYRLKSAFLANMSHEIRTPMNGILGFTGLLKEPGLTGEEQQEFIGIIEESGRRMLNIINDIVDISKIESGLMEVSIKESNINEQIEYIYTFFKPEVEGKGMKLFFKNSLPSKEAIIQTDCEKVFAILTNLIKNAIKYTEKGSIEFGYDHVETQHATSLQFYVKDTGIGIPEDRQSAVFERFIQADISDKMARQGAGLGLSISKAYVEMLGGKIWVESEEGKGSIFYFTIPYNVVSEEKSAIRKDISEEDKEVQVKKLKILIVEDDEPSYSLMRRMLQKISKEVLHAITGVEAVEACRNNPDLDLVLMDIKMSQMDGHEATRQIRQFNKDVIIIAQTAYGFSDDREKAIEVGCNDYISKPINSNLLKELIKKHINK